MNRLAKLVPYILSALCVVGVFALPIAPTACRSVNVWTTPAEVTTTVNLRTASADRVVEDLTTGAMDDSALVQYLIDDEAAWAYLREEAGGWTAQADFVKVLQTQEVGVRVARKQIAAGQYTPQQKLDLVTTLRKAWATLQTYYNPPAGG